MRLPVTPVTTLQRELRAEVRHNYPAGRILLAVDGIEGAGQAAFADGLAEVFAEEGAAAYRASIRDFHRPRAERDKRGRTSARGAYEDAYDYPTFRRVLIDPFRDGASTSATTGFQLTAFDLGRDAPTEAAWVTAPRDAVLIVDGVFLNRPELRGIWHWSLWLEASFEVAYARLAARRGYDPDPRSPANSRYVDGQMIYLTEAKPRAAASALVDNTDPSVPSRMYQDFC